MYNVRIEKRHFALSPDFADLEPTILYSIRFLPLKGFRGCPLPDNHFQQCASSLPRWWQQHASVPKSWKHMFFNFPPSVFLRVYRFVGFQNNFHLFQETHRSFRRAAQPFRQNSSIAQGLAKWDAPSAVIQVENWRGIGSTQRKLMVVVVVTKIIVVAVVVGVERLAPKKSISLYWNHDNLDSRGEIPEDLGFSRICQIFSGKNFTLSSLWRKKPSTFCAPLSKRHPSSKQFPDSPPSGMCWQQSSWSYRHFGNQRDP